MSNPIDRRSFLAGGTAVAAGLTIASATGVMFTGSSAAQAGSSGKHADGISTAKPKRGGKLTGAFPAQVWTQFSATDPDRNDIFWSPTQINSAFSINMARNTDPATEASLLKGRQSSDPTVLAQAYQQVSTLMAKDLPSIWTDRNAWAIASQPQVESFNNPTTPAGKPAFGLIAGAIWPGQIWLNS